MVARMVIFVTEGRSSVCGHDIWVAFMIHEERLLRYTLQRSTIPNPVSHLPLGLNEPYEVSQRDTCGACKLTKDYSES